MRYRFFVNEKEKTIYCVSRYAGKPVRGIAKCSPVDTFDIEKGRELAKLRCDIKIAQKRVKNATLKLHNTEKAISIMEKHHDEMKQYHQDAVAELAELTYYKLKLDI